MTDEAKVKANYVGGGFLYGIPARDLTDEDWKRLTDEQRAIVAASPVFEIVAPAKKNKRRRVVTAASRKDGE